MGNIEAALHQETSENLQDLQNMHYNICQMCLKETEAVCSSSVGLCQEMIKLLLSWLVSLS